MLSAVRRCSFPLIVALMSVAIPASASEPGEPYLVADIDLTGEPYYEECHVTCPPPTPVYGSLIEQLTPLGDLLVFVANDRIHGFEPWVSDGTAGGTRMLADTCAGFCHDLSPVILGALGDRLYFSAATDPGEPSLWVTDGTPEGTRPLPELCPELCSGSIFGPAVVYEGSLFVSVYEYVGGPARRNLWRTDGTPAGTERIQPLCPRMTCSGDFSSFFEYEGRLFYADSSNLQRLDGSAAQPVVAWAGEPLDAAVLGDRAILAVGGSPPSLWILDDPLAEPRLLTQVDGRWIWQLTAADGFVYFGVRDEPGLNETLWRTDGTAAGTGPVVPDVSGDGVEIVGLLDGDPVVAVQPEPSPLPVVLPTLWRIGATKAEALSQLPIQSVAVVGDRIFFSAEDGGLTGRELWVSDGTAEGTRLLADVAPGAVSSEPGSGGRYRVGFAAAGDRLFFPAFHPDFDIELWALELGTEDEEPPLPPPPPPSVEWLESPEVPGYRVQVRISGGGSQILGSAEPACIPETLCVSGAVAGRSEVFVRVVGPKPNGFFWPTIVKFSTSTVEVWIEQESSGAVRYYLLEGAAPGVDELPGLFDRMGFSP